MNPERELFPPDEPEELPPPEQRLFPSKSWAREKARAGPPRRLEDDPISRVECPRCGIWVYCRQSEIAWWLDGHLQIRHKEDA